MALSLSLSLSLPCGGVNSNPSALLRSRVLASPKTLTVIPTTQNSRNRRLSVQARQSQSDYYETQFSSRPQDGSFSPFGAQSAKVFVSHSIYKGKGALTLSPKAPDFSTLDSGAYKVTREGCVFLEFAPGLGNRQFDWNRKQIFTLSVVEVGTLISLGPKDSCEFFHDPFLGKSEEGQVRKVFKAEPLPDGSGHYFNLGVTNKLANMEESIYIPITKGEFAVLRSALDYLIPYLLGWNTFANSIGPESGRSNNFRSGELEWGR